MADLNITGKGCFPLYFRHPEETGPFFDQLGFRPGFKREHSSGLTFYIHRTKNKKEVAPFGLTIPLLVKSLKEFKESIQHLPSINFESPLWFDQPSLLLTLADQKKFLIIQEDQLLPPKLIYQAKQSSNALYGNGYLILNSKSPEKAAAWYESFLECETVYRSEKMAISIMTNFNETEPGLVIFHQLENDSKKIGPLNYKNFCLTTKNIYAAWEYLKSKNKINPRWKNPQEDGIYRTILLSGTDGYCWKIYGEMPTYSINDAAKMLKQTKEEIITAIQKEFIPVLKEKSNPNATATPTDSSLICEDHLLHYYWRKSPYSENLTFPL